MGSQDRLISIRYSQSSYMKSQTLINNLVQDFSKNLIENKIFGQVILLINVYYTSNKCNI
jgi:hypothetical protein